MLSYDVVLSKNVSAGEKILKLGFFTMPLHPMGSKQHETMQDDLEQIKFLDDLGFHEAWVGEHFTAEWENIPAPDIFLAYALAHTKNIILGTGVSCLAQHNPFMLAHRIAVLDNLAKGRFYWGIGAGSFIGDFKAFGVDPSTGEQRDLMNESLEFILDLWNNPKPGDYKNRKWSFTVPERMDDVGLGVHTKPYQTPHPPIAVAGITEKSGSLKTAGRKGWIPMSINFVPQKSLAGHWASYEEGAKESGVTADRTKWRIARDIYVADTTEQAIEDVKNGTLARDFEEYFFKLVPRMRGNLNVFKTDKSMTDEEVTMDYMIENLWIVGSPEDVTRQIKELYEYVGGFGVLMVMGHEWKPLDKWQKSMKLLKEKVIPNI